MSGRLGKKGDKSENEKKLIFEFFKSKIFIYLIYITK